MATNPGRVQLRDVLDDDIPLFFEQQLDPAYNHMAAFTRKDHENRDAFMAHWAKLRRDPSVIARTILFDGAVVGNVASFVMYGAREITYGVDRGHWGKGIATKALGQFLHEFQERPLHGRAAADNQGSIRVLEKCGFTLCGQRKGFANARGQEIEEVVLKLE